MGFTLWLYAGWELRCNHALAPRPSQFAVHMGIYHSPLQRPQRRGPVRLPGGVSQVCSVGQSFGYEIVLQR